MRLDFRSSKTLGIFAASFCAGFATFLLIEYSARLSPNTATAQPAESRSPADSGAGDAQAVNALAKAEVRERDSGRSRLDAGESSGPNEAGSPEPGVFRPEVGKVLVEQSDAEISEELALSPDTAAKPSPTQSSTTALAPSPQPQLQPSQPLAGITGSSRDSSISAQSNVDRSSGSSLLANSSQPSYEIAWADASNYGERFTHDIFKKPATQQPIIVLHETVSSADSAINYFQTPHVNDADQASYHTLIRRNGVVVYLVPPEKRAYGAGDSVFVGPDGREESIKTHKQFASSVNNFAYHISLESPTDGYGDGPSHSGYSQAQYDSLAWLIGQSTVPWERITTHQTVDRSGQRSDPRSFDFRRLQIALGRYRRW